MNAEEHRLTFRATAHALVEFNGATLDLTLGVRPQDDVPPIWSGTVVLERVETRGHPTRPDDELLVLHFAPTGQVTLSRQDFIIGRLTRGRLDLLAAEDLFVSLTRREEANDA